MRKSNYLFRILTGLCLIFSVFFAGAFDSISEKYDIDVPQGMVYIEEGMSMIGAEDGDLHAKTDAKPRHTVYLKSYYIDLYEVTNDAYAECVEAGVCSEPQDSSSATRENYYGNESFGRFPVVNVTWNEAQAYCEFVDKRLPTEAEWEKAGLGTVDYRRYSWGNGEPKNYTMNITLVPGDTEMGNSYPEGASPYGLVDVVGNVSEWVADWYASGYYAESPLEDPAGPADGTQKVVRGDSWNTELEQVHVTNRYALEPDAYNAETGFRCAKDVKEKVYYDTPVPDENPPEEQSYAVVNSGHDSGIFLLETPGTNETIIAVAPNGSLLEILEGPVEINYTNWYHVRTASGWEGWTIGSSLTLTVD